MGKQLGQLSYSLSKSEKSPSRAAPLGPHCISVQQTEMSEQQLGGVARCKYFLAGRQAGGRAVRLMFRHGRSLARIKC